MRKIIIVFSLLALSANLFAGTDEILRIMEGQEFSGALEEINKLLSEEPDNKDYLILLSEIQTALGEIEESRKTYKRILRVDPLNYTALLNLARIESWSGNYDESVRYYIKAGEASPEEYSPLVEKARVMGWAGDTRGAVEAYREAYSVFPYKWIKYEKKSKEALWSGKPRRAMRYFRESLAENPDNQEILRDAAKLSSDTGDYEKAEEYYKRLLEINPYLDEAASGRRRNYRLLRGVKLRSGIDYWKAESEDRNTDVELITPSASVTKSFGRVTAGLEYLHQLFSFSEGDSLSLNSGRIFLSYTRPLYFGLGGGYAAGIMDEESSLRESYYFYLWSKVTDNFDARLLFTGAYLVNNRENILDKIFERSGELRLELTPLGPGRRVGADYKFADISDDNSYSLAGIDFRMDMPVGANSAFIESRAEGKFYDEESERYFSPESYTIISLRPGFRLNLNNKSKKFYTELSCKISIDSNDELSCIPGLEVYREFSNASSMRMSFKITESRYYRDILGSVSAELIF